jgi:hypothetical protein
MSFWYAEANADGSRNAGTDTLILPAPTAPEYGQRFPYTLQPTAGRAVRQRGKQKVDELKWVWKNYQPWVPRYETLYWTLFKNQAHIRKADGKSPYMYLKEDVTLNFGKFNNTTKRIDSDWVRVLITYVGRTEQGEGGNVRYPLTEVRFVIDDSTITDQR